VQAQTSSSPNFQVQESGFSSGSELDANSANFNARVSAGDNAVGQAESLSFLTLAGPISPDEEYIELNVPAAVIDMGTIAPGDTGTGSATFTARSYLNDNYVIISLRDPPTSENGEVLDPITTAAPFDPSQESFGMNLVANTQPTAQGADPAHQPDNSFAYGEACLLYTSPSPRDRTRSRMPSSA